MAKDPAFLFYPNDWIGGTMGMTFEEKGAYMEILMMQFNRGHMTKHMIEQTIGHIWVNIMDKFEVDDKNMYFNRRLDDEKEKRQNYVGTRRNNRSGKNQYTKIDEKPRGHMTSHMENENIYIDIIENNEEIIEIEKQKLKMVILEMYKVWQENNPFYPKDEQRDYHALLQFAYKIAENKKWSKSDIVGEREKEVVLSWGKICKHIMSDSFLRGKPLSTCANQWQAIFMGMQKKSNGMDHLESKRVLPEDYFTNK